MSEVLYPWGPQQGSSSGVLPFTLQIAAPFPAVQLAPTEAGGVFFDMQEVSGDTWFVTNAVYNTNAIGGAAWQQNNMLLNTGSINPANPAYALVLRANGSVQRLFTAATNNVNTAISWVTLDTIDAQGDLVLAPTNTLAAQVALQVTPTWNAGSNTLTAAQVNVTDTASNAASKLLDLQVGGVSKFTVRKDGTITTAVSILTPSASATPLTVSGVGGQSVDIFDVTLTSGGTKALLVNSVGGVAIGVGGLAPTFGQLGVSASTSSATITLGGSVSSGAWDYGATTPTTHTWSVAGVSKMTLNASTFGTTGSLTAATLSINSGITTATGQISCAASASSGVYVAGSVAATAGFMDYGATTANIFSFQKNTGTPAYVALNASAFTVSSDASFKSNVAASPHGLAAIKALKPSRYTVTADGTIDLGFIAQDVQSVIPEAVRTDGNGKLGLNYNSIYAANVMATQELAAAFEAYVAAHP